MAISNLKFEFSHTDFTSEDKKNKKKKETIFDEIKIKICALLNTNGGRLVLIASDATANKIHADDIINPIEQWLEKFIGLSITEKNFKWKPDYNTITIEIVGLPILCTLNTNLFLPTQSSIYMLCQREPNRIRDILFGRRFVEIPQQTVPEHFNHGLDSDLRESKSVQLKNLNAEKTKSMNLAGRIMKHKLTSYVSGFANLSGGQIFYGIDDHGIVVGELLQKKEDQDNIKMKVGNAIQKMIWPAELGEIQCGKQWDINFVPVKNCDSETLPLTFVTVISVLPCSGGVFAKEPESCHVVDGEVKKIPFDTWKEKVKTGNSGLKRKDEVPMEITRKKWSSVKNEKAYMKVNQEFVKLRQLGQWSKIEEMYKILHKQENRHKNTTKRVSLFRLISEEYHRGDKNALNHLKELRNRMTTSGDEDKSITCLGERYSASAIERSRGNYQNAWKIMEEGLQHCADVPAGLVPAAFYTNAALYLSKMVDDESFIGVSRKDECFKDKVQENVERVEDFYDLALQQIEHVEDDFKIAKEDVKQRINITLAFLYLKSESINHSQVSSSDIDKAAKKICEAEISLNRLEGTARLKFNYCYILLAKCDLCLRQYQLKETDIDNELKTDSLEHLAKSSKNSRRLRIRWNIVRLQISGRLLGGDRQELETVE